MMTWEGWLSYALWFIEVDGSLTEIFRLFTTGLSKCVFYFVEIISRGLTRPVLAEVLPACSTALSLSGLAYCVLSLPWENWHRCTHPNKRQSHLIADITNRAPTAGGQYHWVAMLAPRSSRKVLSYITGWLTVLGWQANIAAASYLTGTAIQGIIVLTSPSYNPKGWHGTLLTWAVAICSFGINACVSSVLAKIEILVMILHVIVFVAVLVPLVYLSPRVSPQQVFTVFTNAGGWSTQSLSFFVGIVGTVFAFLGADGAVHISEEVKNASVVVPRSMVLSMVINGALAFGILVATLFSLVDIEKIISTPPIEFPFMAVFTQAAGSKTKGSGLVAVIVFMFVWATITSFASASRVTWSFARDRGLPFSDFLGRVGFHIRTHC